MAFQINVVCWRIQSHQSNVENHLSSPSSITVCARMCWIKIESGVERGSGCVRIPFWQRVIFSSSMPLPSVFGHLWGREVHLVNVECEIRIQSSTSAINILFLPCTHTSRSHLMYATSPAGLLCARKHASLCYASTVQEKAARCGYKSLICWKVDLDCHQSLCQSCPDWPLSLLSGVWMREKAMLDSESRWFHITTQCVKTHYSLTENYN